MHTMQAMANRATGIVPKSTSRASPLAAASAKRRTAAVAAQPQYRQLLGLVTPLGLTFVNTLQAHAEEAAAAPQPELTPAELPPIELGLPQYALVLR